MTIEIKTKIQRLNAKIDAHNAQIKQLRMICTHPEVIKTAKSDTGNWCKDDDAYWYEFVCEECGSRWQEEQRIYNQRMREDKWVWEKDRKIIER